MKTTYQIVVILLTIFLGTISTEAQILKKLKKGVQQATEEVLVEKAAEEIAEETEKLLDTLTEEQKQGEQEEMNAVFGQGGEDIQTEPVYQFDTNVHYEMVFESNGESSRVAYSMWFSKSENYMGTEVTDMGSDNNQDIPVSMMTILDDKNQATIVLMEEQKIAQVIAMDRLKEVAEEEGTEAYFESLEKTGNRKQILGYDCEEYRSVNADLVYTFWITNDLNIYNKSMFYNLNKSLGGNTFGKIPNDAKGFMMEMTFEDNLKNEKGRMLVKDIKAEHKSVEMDAYQFMNLSQLMNQQ